MSSFLQKEDCILLVVDIQERLHAAMDKQLGDSYVKNCVTLLETSHACGVPIIVSEQYPKGLGRTIAEVTGHLEGVPKHEKLHFSCFRDENIRKAIEYTGRKTVIIIGIEAHVCVMQTALDLLDGGYRAVIAADAVCSRRTRDMDTALDTMAIIGALVYPTETIAFMLIEKAGTELFKKLSPMFK